MAQCTFGSRPKAGVGAYVWITWDLLVAFIASRFPKLGLLSDIPWDNILVSTDSFCSTEVVVPAPPGLTVWVTALAGNLGSLKEIADYVTQLFLQFTWSVNCECIPNPSPGGSCYPHYTSPPSLTDTAGGSGWCWGLRFTPADNTTKIYGARLWLTPEDTSPMAIRLWDCTTTGNLVFASFAVPTGGASNPVSVYLDTPISLLPTHNYSLTYQAAHNHVMLASGGVSGTNGPIAYGPSIIGTDCNVLGPCADTRSDHYGIDPIICTADPRGIVPFVLDTPEDLSTLPTIADPTCTTTADLCARILELEQKINLVTDIARWISTTTAPTGYSIGAVHSVSGSGTLAVAGIVGVLVEPSVPTRWGRTSDVPRRYIPKVGVIHFGDGTGSVDETQIHYDEQLVFGAPPLATTVSYSFPPGITAVVTELLRLK